MAGNPEEILVKYLTFQSVVDHTFWHKLFHLKLNVDRLEENERDLWGLFLQPDICSLFVDYKSFNSDAEWKLYSSKFTSLSGLCSAGSKCNFPLVSARGSMTNFNTLDGFKNCDKTALLSSCGESIKQDIVSERAVDNPTLLTRFKLITYSDLKKYDFYYWFSFPATLSFQASYVGSRTKLIDLIKESQFNELFSSHESLLNDQRTVFGVILDVEAPRCVTLRHLINYLNAGEDANAYLCYLDPSNDFKHPGWPLRNILALIAYHWKDVERVALKVISFRVGPLFYESPVFSVAIKVVDSGLSKWVGWETNVRNKLGPRFTSLRDTMDPVRLADSSAELNLKLMKWRLAPNLDLDSAASQKVVILGAGTLGCALARNLLCWGVRHITFVDCGSVSYSNPVRQCLYTQSDCLKEKATAAAAALKQILPSVHSFGEVLEIPMPGHPTANVENAERLHSIIASHDAVFLVTDSRESRWLPTLVAGSLDKVCITSALGFDSYLVIRHGRTSGGSETVKLGCYFCNDVTAPGNSTYDRTLDQQCTVSRPGVSNMAASLASELFVSMLQPLNKVNLKRDDDGGSCTDECSLGLVPHSIRGFLSNFNHMLLSTNAFSKCIACSQTVLDLYQKDRENFLSKVFESNTYLEEVTGLSELHRQTEELQDLSDFSLSDSENKKLSSGESDEENDVHHQ